MKNISKLLLASCIILSCKSEQNTAQQSDAYFSVDTYMKKEIQRLTQTSPKVLKTVAINNSIEEKNVKIEDWKKELEMFVSADINKADWRGLFKVSKNASQQIYQSTEDKVFVKSLIIDLDSAKQVRKVQAIIKRDNLIYISQDTLLYIPDSLYQIKKSQKIKLMEERRYSVTGNFLSNSKI